MAKDDVKNKISIATYGIGTDLDKDSKIMSDIVKQTSLEVASKFGKRLDNKVIDSYTNLNLSNLFAPTVGKKSEREAKSTIDSFKEMMQDNAMTAVQMMTAEQGRIINYSNYKSIVDNIPEMALAKDTYLSNILSPDDYNKAIFNVDYNSTDAKEEDRVRKELKDMLKKYHLEWKTEEIVEKALIYGDCFVSILPYDREIGKFLAQTSARELLNEGLSTPIGSFLDEHFHLTERMHYETLNESALPELIDDEEKEVLTEAFGDQYNQYITDLVNNKIKIKSVTDMLLNRAEAENDVIFSKKDVETTEEKDKKKKKTNKAENLNINGADIRILEPDKIVALEVDGVCYGYYYIEPGFNGSVDQPYSANNPRAYAQASNPLNPSIQPQMATQVNGNPSNPVAKNLNITDEKLSIISNVLLKALSKKLNKKYINDNKQFKDLLYNLLRQKYIFEKGVSITYFLPEEVVHFKTNSIFEKIVFYAKIYLAILTNTVIIKLGRGHDKRIFYIQTGVDNNQEQAIMKVVQDVKTKEFKMSNLGSVTSILQLNPGQFDDLYMPVVNGERPVDIETIAGMDQDISNDFIEFLRKSMVQGTGLPAALLEAADNIEFARQIAAQNANFCRRIVRYQKQLTEPFEQLVRTLYSYEYKYSLDDSHNIDNVELNNIEISFPSPAALNLTNLVDTFTQVDSAADYVAKTYYPERMDQATVDEQSAFKQKVIKKLIVQFDWEEMDELYEKFKDEYKEQKIVETSKNPPQEDDQSNYGGY